MSPRGYITLAAATAIALIAAIVLIVTEQLQASTDRHGTDLMFPALAERQAEITQVSIDALRYDLVLEKRDGQWVAVNNGDYPVRSEPIDTMIAGLATLVEYERKTDNPDNYDLLHVVGPGDDRDDTRVTVIAANGDVLMDAILGKEAVAIGANTRGGMYIRRVDEDRVWLAEGAARPPTFTSDLFDMLFNIPGRDVGRLTILAGDTVLFDAIKTDFATGDYELEYLDPSIGPAGSTANDSAVRGMSQAIVSTTFVNVKSADDVTVAPDARTLRYVTQQGLSLSVTLASDADGTTYVIYTASAAPGSEAEAQAAEITAATHGFAFELQPGRLITFTRDIHELFTPPPPAAPAPEPAPAAPVVPLPVVPAP